MSMIPSWVRQISLWHAVAIAVVAVLLTMFVFTRGILNTVAWVVAIAALAVGVINKVSYS